MQRKYSNTRYYYINDFVATNPSGEDAQKVVFACQEGMAIVGELFEKNEYYVGDLIFAEP